MSGDAVAFSGSWSVDVVLLCGRQEETGLSALIAGSNVLPPRNLQAACHYTRTQTDTHWYAYISTHTELLLLQSVMSKDWEIGRHAAATAAVHTSDWQCIYKLYYWSSSHLRSARYNVLRYVSLSPWHLEWIL